jgi:hypothetical protein
VDSNLIALFAAGEEEYLGLDMSQHGERAISISPSHATIKAPGAINKDADTAGNAA